MNNFHPLTTFKDEIVFELLSDFFEQNCNLADVQPGLGSNLITYVWQNKNAPSDQYQQLRIETLALLKEVIKSCQTKSKEANTLHLISLKNENVVVDIGANKLAALNYFGARFPSIEKLIAVDIVPQQKNFQFPEKSQYIQVSPNEKEIPIESGTVDVVHIQFVLHHLESQQKIHDMLHEAYRILRPKGRLLIWEESFTSNYDASFLQAAQSAGIMTDQKLTTRFYALSDQQKWSFITTLDWIINVGNPHMPWTGQYYDWKTWCQIIEQAGFSKQREINLGLRLNGKLKQGVHMFGEFERG